MNVVLDSTPPTVSAPIVTASNTSGTNPLFVSNENLQLTDNAADSGSGVQSVAYFWCAGNSSCTSATWSPLGSSNDGVDNYPVTWTTPLPADGQYSIVAVGTDNANNVSDPSSATLITVDATGAVASTPGANASVKFGTNPMYVDNEAVNLTDNPSDGAGSGVQSVAYFVCADNGSGGCAGAATQIASSSNAGSNYAVTWNSPLPADGVYRITAVATDNLGNAGTSSAATLVAVDTDTPRSLRGRP